MPGTVFCFVDTAGRQVDLASEHRALMSSREEQVPKQSLRWQGRQKHSRHKQLQLLQLGTAP